MCKVELHSHAVIETCLQWLYSVYLQDAFVKIVRGEGVKALWSGLPPTLWVRRLLRLIYSLAALYSACSPFNDKLLMWVVDSCWPCSWCVHSKSPISGIPGQIGQFTKIDLMLFILLMKFLILNGLLMIKFTFVISLVLFLWLPFPSGITLRETYFMDIFHMCNLQCHGSPSYSYLLHMLRPAVCSTEGQDGRLCSGGSSCGWSCCSR